MSENKYREQVRREFEETAHITHSPEVRGLLFRKVVDCDGVEKYKDDVTQLMWTGYFSRAERDRAEIEKLKEELKRECECVDLVLIGSYSPKEGCVSYEFIKERARECQKQRNLAF